MSSNLYIEPVDRKKTLLSKDLKYAMKKRYFFPLTVNYSFLDYLYGLKDSGLEDSQLIIDYIEKYGECEITEVF